MDDSRKLCAGDIEGLVRASQSEDRGAFDELVRLYQGRAMRLAVGMLGNAEEAAEAVQRGLVKAYLGIDKLKQPNKFAVWLLKIISNEAISQRRIIKRREKMLKIVDFRIEDREVVSPDEIENKKELKEAITRAMLKLTKNEAKAISLFGFEDLSHKEAASVMGCSVSSVKWYVFRARQKLKVLLKDHL